MEANEDLKKNAGASPELAAIALEAIEQAFSRHKVSRAQLENLVNEPQPIFEFFEELLAEEEGDPIPNFWLHPEQQSFVIEALSGECLKVNHAKLVKPNYHARNFAVEAAACFGGDSPSTSETRVRAYRFEGSANALEAFMAIVEDARSLILTRAQIRHFSAKYADIILLRKMMPIFLFDRCELIHDCQPGLMTATTWFDNYSMHINMGSLDRVIEREGDKNFYLIVPIKQGTEHDSFMLEAMEMYTGV